MILGKPKGSIACLVTHALTFAMMMMMMRISIPAPAGSNPNNFFLSLCRRNGAFRVLTVHKRCRIHCRLTFRQAIILGQNLDWRRVGVRGVRRVRGGDVGGEVARGDG